MHPHSKPQPAGEVVGTWRPIESLKDMQPALLCTEAGSVGIGWTYPGDEKRQWYVQGHGFQYVGGLTDIVAWMPLPVSCNAAALQEAKQPEDAGDSLVTLLRDAGFDLDLDFTPEEVAHLADRLQALPGWPYRLRDEGEAWEGKQREEVGEEEAVKIMLESRARDNEGEFPPLFDVIDMAENKARTVMAAAFRALSERFTIRRKT